MRTESPAAPPLRTGDFEAAKRPALAGGTAAAPPGRRGRRAPAGGRRAHCAHRTGDPHCRRGRLQRLDLLTGLGVRVESTQARETFPVRVGATSGTGPTWPWCPPTACSAPSRWSSPRRPRVRCGIYPAPQMDAPGLSWGYSGSDPGTLAVLLGRLLDDGSAHAVVYGDDDPFNAEPQIRGAPPAQASAAPVSPAACWRTYAKTESTT